MLISIPPIKCLPRSVYLRVETLKPGEGFQTHQHPWVQFLYAVSGTLSVTLANRAFIIPTRYGLWIPSGIQHQVTAQTEVEFRSLYIKAEVFENSANVQCQVVEVTSLVRELIIAAVALPQEYDENGRAGGLVATLINELRSLCQTDIDLPTPADVRIRAICEALTRNPSDQRECNVWAEMANVSTRTLARLFQKETGLGFVQWRQRLRLYRSLEMMAAGSSVTTVALEVGYNSTSAFIAAFKSQFGKAPKEFMRTTRQIEM